jgi:hypothetical protein
VAQGAVGGEAPGPLAAHLAPKEPVIRHGGLAFGGLLHGGQFAALLICAGIAAWLPLMVALETEDSGPVAGIALAASVVIVAMSAGGLMPRLTWRGRGTISALTDGRLLTVAGGRVVQDCGPEDVHGGSAPRRMCGQAELWWQVQKQGVGAPLPQGLRRIGQRRLRGMGGGRWPEVTVEASAEAQRRGEALAALRATPRPA